MNPAGYDNPSKCSCCGNDNSETVTDKIEHTPCEIDTICFCCGYEDSWAYGHFFGGVVSAFIDHRIMWRLRTGQVVL
jgi:hypothetical protein